MISTYHIGDNIVFGEEELIGIFSSINLNKELLEKEKDNLNVRNESGTNRSFVLINKKNRHLYYYSKISGRNLVKRLSNIMQEEKNGKKG